MTKVITASQARANIYAIIDETAKTHELILVTGKRNNIVMISQEDWSAIEETLYPLIVSQIWLLQFKML